MSWMTWSPFQSPEVREICEHLTLAEKSAISMRGGLYGLWCAATVVLPIQFFVMSPSSISAILLAGALVVHVLCISPWQRRQREFLCATTWARSQNITPDSLRLFKFKK